MKLIILFFLFWPLASCKTTSGQLEKKTDYHIQLAVSHVVKCLYPQALFNVKEALKIRPRSYMVHDTAGVIYALMKQYDQALFHFGEALKLKPAYTEGRVNRAQTLIKQKASGYEEKALKDLKTALKDLTYVNPAKAHGLIGEIYFHQKKYFKAGKNLKTAVQIDKKTCFYPLYLGRIEAKSGRHKEALTWLSQARRCQRKAKKGIECLALNFDAYYFEALSLDKIGQKDKAKKLMKTFLKKQKDSRFEVSAKKKLSAWGRQ